MMIEIGWGSLETRFREADARYKATVEFVWTERGPPGAAPTGTGFRWWLEPTQARRLAADLIKHAEEYEAWVETEKARLAADHNI